MNERKPFYIRALALTLVFVMTLFSLTACSGKGDDESGSDGGAVSSKDEYDESSEIMLEEELGLDDDSSYYDNPDYRNEDDGAELTTISHDMDDFIGNWEAPSERAAYMYGNVNLKIKNDFTWSGNITEESFKGTWEYDGSRVIIRSSDTMIHWQLFYVEDGNLMFDDMDDPGDPLVLKPGGKFN